MYWYNKSVDECINELGSDIKNGLSSEKAKELLEKNGRNELKQKNKKSLLSKIIDQFKDPMILILIGACIMSAVVGEITDAFIIIAIVVVNAILSLNQEGKAEKAIEALQKMASPMAKVYRDGKLVHIPSPELVVGDIVELETGDIIPADLRLIESFILKIDEASLTGESVPVEKFADKIYDGEIEIGDRENMAYSSTIVAYGRGKGVVVSTGENTEIGKIATTLDSFEDEDTPLQKKLAGLSKSLGLITIGVCIVVFIVGLLYTKFGEKRNWTKKGIILLIAQAVSVGILLAKGIEIMNMFAKVSALYNSLKQYGGSELNSAGNSVGSLASLLLNDAGVMTFILLLAISSIIILVISIMLLGKGTVANVATVENIPPSVSDADKAKDVAAKTAADVKENSEIKEGVSAEKVEKIDEKQD